MKPRLVLALLLIPFSAHAEENLLRLFFLPTYPVRIDWSSPRSNIESTITATIRNRTHAIGHVNIEVDCGVGPGQSRLLGATGAGAGPINNLLLVEKVGYSLLERGWPGQHEPREKILNTFAVRGRDPKQLSMVTFEISAESCQRLLAYVNEYQAATPVPLYGFGPRPRHKEGSGCSAYGASFAEVAGIFTPEFRRAWTTERRIPLTLMAGHAGKTEIPLQELRSSPESARWSTAEEGHMLLEFYDPDRMYEWAKHLAESPEELSALGGRIDTALPYGMQGVPAIRIDRKLAPVPTEPIFDGEPAMVPSGPSSYLRQDRRFEPNGTFEIRP